MLSTTLIDHPRYPAGQRMCLIGDDGHLGGSLDDMTLEAWLTALSQVLRTRGVCALATDQTQDGCPRCIYLA